MSTIANSRIEITLRWKLAEVGAVYQFDPVDLPIPCSFFVELTAKNLGVKDQFGFKVRCCGELMHTSLRIEPGESADRALLGHISEGIVPGAYPVTIEVDLPTTGGPDPIVMEETYIDTITVLPAVLPGEMPTIEGGRIAGVDVFGDIMKVACEVDILNPNSFSITGGDPDQVRLDVMVSPAESYEGWLPNFYRNFSASIPPGLNTFSLWCDGNISGCSPPPILEMDVTLTLKVFIFGWLNNPMVSADFNDTLGGSEPPEPGGSPNEGDKKCVGSALWKYTNWQWVLVENNSPACGFSPADGGDGGLISKYWKWIVAGGVAIIIARR